MDRILIVDDEKLIRWSLKEHIENWGYEPVEAVSLIAAKEILDSSPPIDLIILDHNLPDGTGVELMQMMRQNDDLTPVVMLTAMDDSQIAVAAMKLGALDYVIKPIDFVRMKRVVQRVLDATESSRNARKRQLEMTQEYGFSSMLGSSKEMKKVFKLCAKLAKNDAITVLITGDSGTGKELVAKALHDGSPRSNKPFMTINCSVLTETLIASELFGYEKGAFTDAKARKLGIFEMAKGGTVFLDEIGDMALSLQAKMLRVLEDKTFKRVGGTEDINVDARIISATNQSLEERITANEFRQDLFYRLNIAQIHLPPLRERGGDLQLLAGHFLAEASERHGVNFHGISDEAMEIFKQHSWPGNVRELKNVIERTVLLNDGPILLGEYVEALIGDHSDNGLSPMTDSDLSLPEIEKQALVSALEKSNHNQTQAAKILGITRDTLRYRMRKYEL